MDHTDERDRDMDFELTGWRRMYKRRRRSLRRKEFSDVAREYDEAEEYPTPLWKKACELGFIGAFIKEEYGGPGLSFF